MRDISDFRKNEKLEWWKAHGSSFYSICTSLLALIIFAFVKQTSRLLHFIQTYIIFHTMSQRELQFELTLWAPICLLLLPLQLAILFSCILLGLQDQLSAGAVSRGWQIVLTSLLTSQVTPDFWLISNLHGVMNWTQWSLYIPSKDIPWFFFILPFLTIKIMWRLIEGITSLMWP